MRRGESQSLEEDRRENEGRKLGREQEKAGRVSSSGQNLKRDGGWAAPRRAYLVFKAEISDWQRQNNKDTKN